MADLHKDLEWKSYVVSRPNGPDIHVKEAQLFWVNDFYRGRGARLELYKLRDGRFVGNEEYTSQDIDHAEILVSLDSVYSFFGYGRLAKVLYELADITPVVRL